MQKWDYNLVKVHNLDDLKLISSDNSYNATNLEYFLSEAGDNGWEVVASIGTWLILKKPSDET